MKRQRGFSLIEVIIAFVLLATAMGILLAILGGGLAQVRQSGQASEASLHAQSLLSEIGVLEPIRPGTSSGEFDGGRYRWTLDVREVEDPVPPETTLEGLDPVETVGLQRPGEPVFYLLQLDVAWGEGETGRRLRLSTLRARFPEAVAP